jgi:hypothetical protein
MLEHDIGRPRRSPRRTKVGSVLADPLLHARVVDRRPGQRSQTLGREVAATKPPAEPELFDPPRHQELIRGRKSGSGGRRGMQGPTKWKRASSRSRFTWNASEVNTRLQSDGLEITWVNRSSGGTP